MSIKMIEDTNLDDKETLQNKLSELGIEFKQSYGAKKLKEILDQAINGTEPVKEVVKLTEREQINAARKRANRLVRCIINPLRPEEMNLKAGQLEIGNRKLGKKNLRRAFPLGSHCNGGTHVELWLFNAIKNAKFCKVVINKDHKGIEHTSTVSSPAYNVIEVEPLTLEELNELAVKQKNNALDQD